MVIAIFSKPIHNIDQVGVSHCSACPSAYPSATPPTGFGLTVCCIGSYFTTFHNSKGLGCGGWGPASCAANETSSFEIGPIVAENPLGGRILARGIPDKNNPCSVSDLHIHNGYPNIEEVPVELVYYSLSNATDSAVNSPTGSQNIVPNVGRFARSQRASTTTPPTTTFVPAATCTGPLTTVSGHVTATTLPSPTAAPDAFRGKLGHVKILRNGDDAGCLNIEGSWVIKSDECATFRPQWQGRIPV
jgi:hypothetical protein